MIDFRALNLIKPFERLGQVDVIFCRNVLIYFDAQTKTDVLERIAQITSPDGYLLLGAAETVLGLTPSFQVCGDKRGLYTRTGQRTLARAPGTHAARPALTLVS
jgi:chemotaxis protein methyltransferase CheR